MKGFTNEISSTRKIWSYVEAATLMADELRKVDQKGVCVTANQIAYQKHLEDRRANIAREGLEGTKLEQDRAHYERMDAESRRHNLSDEAIRSQSNAIASSRLAEDILNHRNVEAETSRANREREKLQAMGYDVQRRQLGIQQGQLELTARQLAETSKHNRATEGTAKEQVAIDRDRLTQSYVATGAKTATDLLRTPMVYGGVSALGRSLAANPAIAAGLLGTVGSVYASTKIIPQAVRSAKAHASFVTQKPIISGKRLVKERS